MVDSTIDYSQEFQNGLPMRILNLHLRAVRSSLIFLYARHQRAPSLPWCHLVYQDTATAGTDGFEDRLATTRQHLVVSQPEPAPKMVPGRAWGSCLRIWLCLGFPWFGMGTKLLLLKL